MGLYGIFVALPLIAVILIIGYLWWDARRKHPHYLRKGQVYTFAELEGILQALEERWDQEERTLELYEALMLTHFHLGHGTQAEHFARAGIKLADTSGQPNYSAQYVTGFRHGAYWILAGALKLQARFREGGDLLVPYRNCTEGRRNEFTAYAAWLYYLAEDYEQAQALITEIVRDEGGNYPDGLPDFFRFVSAFMQAKLLKADTVSEVFRLADDQLRIANTDLQRHKDTPYGTRLFVVLNEISELLPNAWLDIGLRRLHIMGQGAEVITEYEAKRAQGDHAYQTAFILSAAYSYLGYGAQAEPLALEALAGIQADGWFEREDDEAIYLTDLIHALIFDASVMQGHFAKAADFFAQHPSRRSLLNYHFLDTAWMYLLAGDEENARFFLGRIGTEQAARTLSDKRQLLQAYLHFKLKMTDSRSQMITLQTALADWDETIDRLVDNPFRQVVQSMVDDIRAMVGIGMQTTTTAD